MDNSSKFTIYNYSHLDQHQRFVEICYNLTPIALSFFGLRRFASICELIPIISPEKVADALIEISRQVFGKKWLIMATPEETASIVHEWINSHAK